MDCFKISEIYMLCNVNRLYGIRLVPVPPSVPWGKSCLSRYGNAGIVIKEPKSAEGAGFRCGSSDPGVVIYVMEGFLVL